jgi:hypothetical protein
MDIDQSIRHEKLARLGAEWAARADKEIWDQVGPSSSGLEKCLFYMSACAEMAAQLYDTVLKDDKLEGAEIPAGVPITTELREGIAQSLLQKTLVLMGARIRNKGYGVALTTKLSFTKVANATGPEKAAEAEHVRLHETCSCTLDQDGNCAECMNAAFKTYRAMVESIKVAKLSEAAGRKLSCRPCLKRHLDAAVAKVVREEFVDLEPEASEMFMRMLLMSSQMVASMEMPLTKKAWSEIQSRKDES